VVATLTPVARKKGVTLSARVEGQLPPLWADPERLRQVLLNLSENAIKFTPQGGEVTLVARLGTVDVGDDGGAGSVLMLPAKQQAIELLVIDTGVGIDEKERPRVFDAFYQVDSSA